MINIEEFLRFYKIIAKWFKLAEIESKDSKDEIHMINPKGDYEYVKSRYNEILKDGIEFDEELPNKIFEHENIMSIIFDNYNWEDKIVDCIVNLDNGKRVWYRYVA